MRAALVIVVPSLPKWISDFNILSDVIARQGFDCAIFYPRANGRPDAGWDSARAIGEAERQLHPKLARHQLPVSRNAGPLRPLQLVRTMGRALILAFQPDTVFILWSAFPTVFFGPFLRLFDRPVLYLITGLGIQFSERWRGSWRFRLSSLLYRWLFSSRKAQVIVHNTEDRQFLIEELNADPSRVHVTGGCGVDPEEFPYREHSTGSDTPVILVPSRILRDKGVLDAAEASRLLSERGIAHRMIFTSNLVRGRPDALTDEELERAAALPRVEFTGYCDDLKALYAEADIVCIPSWYREGLQTAQLEAASAGCPLVICDNVGVRDFVRPGVDALVVPPRDPGALADALAAVIIDPDAAEARKVEAHRRLLSAFTQRHMLEITLGVLTSMRVSVATSSDL